MGEKRPLPVPGFSVHRLAKSANNPREVAFWEQWLEEHGEHRTGFIGQLIPACTERDSKVASTIIQWLGSNVGMSFIEEAAKRSKDLRHGLLTRMSRVIAQAAGSECASNG